MPVEAVNDAPVIVVGGGPVGFSLALGLAHHGVRSIVLEKEVRPSTESRALGVWARTIEILRDWGAGEALCAAGTYYPAASIHDARDGRPLFTIDFTTLSDVFDNPGGLIVPQYDTERILRERAIASGMCDARTGWEVVGIEQDDAGVSVTVKHDGGESVVRGAYAAGCDGAHGVTRRLLGMSLDGTTYANRAIISDERLEDDDASAPFIRLAIDYPGFLIGIRYAPKTWRVIASIEPGADETAALGDAVHAKRLRTVFGRAPRGETLWKSAFELHRRRARAFVVGRVALAGDAAHLVSPAGGEGMNAGLQDTGNLAWKLAHAVHGRGDATALLASYNDERQQIIADTVDAMTDKLTKFTMQTPVWVKKIGLGVMTRMLRERGIQRKACRNAGMLTGRYTKSALIDSRHPLAGRRIDDLVLPNGSRINRARAGKATLIAVGKIDLEGLHALRVPVPPKRWVVKPPVVLVVRPDGIVAAVVEKPTRAKVEAAWEKAFAGERLSVG
jgi:2-polyprenyl-6-methoxyphenol hydroxylase-like FAD-dependent oxidoreductase